MTPVKKEIKQYMAWLDTLLRDDNFQGDWRQVAAALLVRIRFYQHERLIHLLVTVTFALLTVVSFAVSCQYLSFLWLALLFLVLEIPYIAHYYFLENAVQKLYQYYYQILERIPPP